MNISSRSRPARKWWSQTAAGQLPKLVPIEPRHGRDCQRICWNWSGPGWCGSAAGRSRGFLDSQAT
ncbi:MAG: hypothetical protein MZV49_14730 [Rhodopseudomonas palustris]|nr:hypothetical protein [Rhodopseudomonas palustris]